jgi:salicylate hydroxylase
MSAANNIIIVGGGIGGLAAALALLRHGLDVEVYEQSSELKEVGAGVQIGANGTRVLHALGLKAALERTQVIPSGKEARLWNTGASWKTLDLGAIAVARYGSPHILMHRGDLHAALAEAIRGIKADALKLGHRFVGLAQSSEGVEVSFADGKSAAAGLVIGADGIHSKVREILFGRDSAKFTGCVAWRGLIAMQELPQHLARNTATSWLGPAGHVLHYPVRSGQLMNFISFLERTDWQVESWTMRGTTEELANDFRGWHSDVHAMIRGIETPYKWALWVRDPMAGWSRGRVTLLGDACHPTLPFLGQGAVMALEDAYVLAQCVGKYPDDHATALARYENARMDRTATVVRAAAETRKRAFDKALADTKGTAAYLAQEWQHEPVMARYDKVYAYDATSVAI